MLHGYGWEITSSDVGDAFDYLIAAVKNAGDMMRALDSLHRLLDTESELQPYHVRNMLLILMNQIVQKTL